MNHELIYQTSIKVANFNVKGKRETGLTYPQDHIVYSFSTIDIVYDYQSSNSILFHAYIEYIGIPFDKNLPNTTHVYHK